LLSPFFGLFNEVRAVRARTPVIGSCRPAALNDSSIEHIKTNHVRAQALIRKAAPIWAAFDGPIALASIVPGGQTG
jgi:hypothetical protein